MSTQIRNRRWRLRCRCSTGNRCKCRWCSSPSTNPTTTKTTTMCRRCCSCSCRVVVVACWRSHWRCCFCRRRHHHHLLRRGRRRPCRRSWAAWRRFFSVWTGTWRLPRGASRTWSSGEPSRTDRHARAGGDAWTGPARRTRTDRRSTSRRTLGSPTTAPALSTACRHTQRRHVPLTRL